MSDWPRLVAERRDDTEHVRIEVDVADDDVVLRVQAIDRSAAEKAILVAGANVSFGDVSLEQDVFLQPAAARQAAAALVAAADSLEAAAAGDDTRAGPPSDPGQAPLEDPLPDPSNRS